MRDKEIANLEAKILAFKKEFKNQNKPKKTENEKVVILEQKIKMNENIGKEIMNEIKALKKLQHDNGNELIDLDISGQYPEKIK